MGSGSRRTQREADIRWLSKTDRERSGRQQEIKLRRSQDICRVLQPSGPPYRQQKYTDGQSKPWGNSNQVLLSPPFVPAHQQRRGMSINKDHASVRGEQSAASRSQRHESHETEVCRLG